jgi:hypothetical protein
MKIVRRIGINAHPHEREQLSRLGVELPHTRGSPSLVEVFLLDEADPRWPAVRDWFLRRGERPGWEETVFTKAEIGAAQWVNLLPAWHHGYPQPEDEFGYLTVTYDGKGCRACGTGYAQREPFRMTGEPRWGTRGLLQVNWVFDEYFVTPEVAAWLREHFNVQSEVVLNRRGRPLETVRQLVVEEVVSMPRADLPAAVCSACGVEKILPIRRGPMRQLAASPVGHLARTREWFGDGHSAFHEVVISRDLRVALDAAHVRGQVYRPVAEGPWEDPGAGQPADIHDPGAHRRLLGAIEGDSVP